LKNCVNPPSAEAESDTPCDENPLALEGAAAGVAGRGTSAEGRAAGVAGGVTPETKIRVNSLCAASGCGFTGDAAGGAPAGEGAGRCPRLLNMDVNSPGPVLAPGLLGAAGFEAGAAGAVLAGFDSRSATGSAGFWSWLVS